MLTWFRRYPDLSVALGLLLLAILFFLPYLLQPSMAMIPRSNLGTDFFHYRWSSVAFLRQSLQQDGEFPLWFTQLTGGAPLVGNPSTFLFYPPQLFLALSPISLMTTFTLQSILHLSLAGWGGYILAYQVMGLRRAVAVAVALGLMFTPRISSNMVGDLNVAYSLCWSPLCLGWAFLALERQSWRWSLAAGVALACLYIIHVQFFYYTALVIGLYFLFNFIRQPGVFFQQGRYLFLMVLICIGLSAFHLLPFLTYLDYLSREDLSLEAASVGSLPPIMLISTIIPIALKFPEWEIYIGLLPLTMLPLIWQLRRERWVVFWGCLTVLFAMLSLGKSTPFFALAFWFVPGFDWLRVPPRLWFYTIIAMIMLWGVILQAMTERRIKLKFGHVLMLASVLMLITVVGRFVTRRPDEADWLLGFTTVLSMCIALGAIWHWQQQKLAVNGLIVLLSVSLMLDLFPLDMAFMRPEPIADYFEVTPLISPILATRTSSPERFRVYGVRGEFTNQMAVEHDIDIIHGMNSFQFEPYVQRVKVATGCNIPGFTGSIPPCSTDEVSQTAYLEAIPDPALLGELNVRYMISPMTVDNPAWRLITHTDEGYLYENSAYLPRIYSKTADGQLIPVEIEQYSPNRIQVHVSLPDAGELILSEVWTPGWHARINGQVSEVRRVNETFRGINLAAGEHQVELYFRPASFLIGLVITGLTGLMCLLALAMSYFRKQETPS